YAVLTVFSMFVPWILLGMEAGKHLSPQYVGAGPMLCSLAGIYLNFLPEKKIKRPKTLYGRWEDQPEPDEEPNKRFGLSPWAYIAGFVVFQLAVHVAALGAVHPVDTIALLPGFLAFVAGYFACLAFVMSAAGQVGASAMKLLAISHYKKLRTLDMSHEEALLGAASLLSVPTPQVKRWITQGGGPLHGPMTTYKHLGG